MNKKRAGNSPALFNFADSQGNTMKKILAISLLLISSTFASKAQNGIQVQKMLSFLGTQEPAVITKLLIENGYQKEPNRGTPKDGSENFIRKISDLPNYPKERVELIWARKTLIGFKLVLWEPNEWETWTNRFKKKECYLYSGQTWTEHETNNALYREFQDDQYFASIRTLIYNSVEKIPQLKDLKIPSTTTEVSVFKNLRIPSFENPYTDDFYLKEIETMNTPYKTGGKPLIVNSFVHYETGRLQKIFSKNSSGKLHGWQQRFSKSGSKIEEVLYIDGLKNGPSIRFDKLDTTSICYYQKGVLNGDSTNIRYISTGNFPSSKVIYPYQNGILNNWIREYEISDGKWRLKKMIEYKNGQATGKQKNEFRINEMNTLIWNEYTIINGKKEGPAYAEIDSAGNYSTLNHFKKDILDGQHVSYTGVYHNQKINKSKTEGKYINGKKNGVWTTKLFLDDNKEVILEQSNYIDDLPQCPYFKVGLGTMEIVDQKSPGGKFIRRLYTAEEQYTMPSYDIADTSKFILTEWQEVVNNQKHGTAIEWNEDNAWYAKGEYVNGQKHGEWIARFNNGRLKTSALDKMHEQKYWTANYVHGRLVGKHTRHIGYKRITQGKNDPFRVKPVKHSYEFTHIRIESNYVDGVLEGDEIYYSIGSSEKLKVMHYKNGSLSGSSYTYMFLAKPEPLIVETIYNFGNIKETKVYTQKKAKPFDGELEFYDHLSEKTYLFKVVNGIVTSAKKI